MSIRVANIILEGRIGGPQRRILQVAERLQRNGIQTIVILPTKSSDAFYGRLTERDIKAIRCHLDRFSLRPLRFLRSLLWFIPQVWRLRNLLIQEQVQIVHCNGVRQPHGVIAGRLAGKKVVLHLNDTYTPGVVKILFAAIGRLSDEFIVAGLGVRNAYFTGFNRSLGRKAITEIQAPVDTAHFDPGRVDSDGRLGGDDSIKITAVGNINPLKGLEYFIDMAHMLNALHTGLTFHVIGPQLASQEAYFRRLMALLKEKGLENVVFHGGSEDIAPALKASDIFICSSLREASPMAVWEAMAMKKAIVSTDVGDVSRFIDNGENGFVVPIKDAAALAEKVGVLIEGETMRRRFGDGVRVIATRELSLDSCVAKHEAVYSQVLATDGSATA